MTSERRAELAARAIAAGDGSVDVPSRELIELLAELALFRRLRHFGDRAGRIIARLDRLEPYIARAAAALESARGVARQLKNVELELANASAQSQYAATVAELETDDGGESTETDG